MDDYEQDVARQPRGPFTKVAERQLIRRVAEHWTQGQRYSAERNRRYSDFARYAKWISSVGGGGLIVYKVIEAFLGKGF